LVVVVVVVVEADSAEVPEVLGEPQVASEELPVDLGAVQPVRDWVEALVEAAPRAV
jgi:hypothetical protein